MGGGGGGGLGVGDEKCYVQAHSLADIFNHCKVVSRVL